jgi:hypothetical protein
MTRTSCRSAERKAKLAILDVMNAGDCSDETRLRALARLLGVTHGAIFEIESRQPPPPKTDPKPFVEVYI